jgi:hypothetical protein
MGGRKGKKIRKIRIVQKKWAWPNFFLLLIFIIKIRIKIKKNRPCARGKKKLGRFANSKSKGNKN